jgi:hypothetical protein
VPRKSRRDFVNESRKSPYELALERPPNGRPNFVTFLDPNKLETGSAFDLSRETDPEIVIRKLLSEEDFAAWWDEWKTVPVDETNALLDDVMEHYGADRKKLPR